MKYKIIISISVVLTISLGYFLFKLKQNQKVLGEAVETSYAIIDVNLHFSADDCWTVIDDSVYDLTKFFSNHPGGEKILMACGKNATDFFNGTNPLGRMHSEIAKNILSGMKIGNFKSN